MSTGLGDNEVISRVLQGEQNAYAELVTRYQGYVFTLVMRMIKSREDAEEVAQDIFVKAYRSLADFRGESKFSTWLYTIVNTTCITFLRKKKLWDMFLAPVPEVFHQFRNRQDKNHRDYGDTAIW